MNRLRAALTSSSVSTGIALAMAGLLLVVIVRCAWVCDDAFITVRTVDNLLGGHGLTWNPGERVQTYTHPLWMALLVAAEALGGEAYWTVLGLALATTLVFLARLAIFPRLGVRGFALAMAALLGSKAFVDYSTSGLENPLIHLILATFFAAAWAERKEARPGRLTLLAALGTLARPDTALFFAPAVLIEVSRGVRERGWRSVAGSVALGGLPLALWAAFATWYYGTPWPNTAYAKLDTGLPAFALIGQGLAYLGNSLLRDPITLTVVAAASIAAVVHRRTTTGPAALGAVLYLVYVVWIGGDFMSGRLLTGPLVVAILILGQLPEPTRKRLTVPALVVLGLTVLHPGSPIRSGRDYGTDLAASADHRETAGIADERAVYYPKTGLLPVWRGEAGFSEHPWAVQGRRVREDIAAGRLQNPVVTYTIGFFGWAAGPRVQIIDVLALSSPLLARLPVEPGAPWRPGHYPRFLPDGYLESERFGVNRIADPDLAIYYGALRTITRGDLWSRSRLEVVVAMACGSYDRHLEAYLERRPGAR